jgi:hypothetical protein
MPTTTTMSHHIVSSTVHPLNSDVNDDPIARQTKGDVTSISVCGGVHDVDSATSH